jgi:hypothetical protein
MSALLATEAVLRTAPTPSEVTSALVVMATSYTPKTVKAAIPLLLEKLETWLAISST